MRERLTTTTAKGIFWKGDKLIARVTIVDPKTDKPKESAREVPRPEGMGAREYLDRAVLFRASLRLELSRTAPDAARKRFGEYAAELTEEKIKMGIIASPATIQKYKDVDKHVIADWGDVFLDTITRRDVKSWLASLGAMAQKKEYTPNTVNDWWARFKSIMTEACEDYGLGDPTSKLHAVPLSLHRTYTKKEPNALTPKELVEFFAATRDRQPHHYAMLVHGFLTGRRGCELYPLRRKGDDPDLDWTTGELEIRRSYTIGPVPTENTKQKKDLIAYLPDTMLDVLDQHVKAFPKGGKQEESDLLFPPRWLRTGPTEKGFQSRWGLRKPLADICEAAGIKKHITPRAMRRTYQDICRAANVKEEVQKAMSGHATDEMKEWYSTVGADEGRTALVNMCSIVGIN